MMVASPNGPSSKLNKLFAFIFLLLSSNSVQFCKKEEGPGGKASISGNVVQYDFDDHNRVLIKKGPAIGENVYITYDDDPAVRANVATDNLGNFEFRYLRKGHYRVFVNSLDTSIKYSGDKTKLPVIRDVEIKNDKQAVTAETMTINV